MTILESTSTARPTRAEYEEIASWMVDEVRRRGRVSLAEFVEALAGRDGGRWLNPERPHALDDRLLATFRRAHAGTIRWVQSGQYWATIA
jgi:hypothetical protein